MIGQKERAGLNRIGHSKITESALQSIKLYILQNNLKAGDLLPPELELSEVLGISRPSMREAIRSLEALGVIRTVHGVGRFIRDFNYDAMVENLTYNLKIHVNEFREIIDVRMALEEVFLAKSMDLLEESDYRDIEHLLDLMEKQIAEKQSEEELVQTHTKFHLKLYEKVNNKLLTNLIGVFATFQRILSVMKRYKTSDYAQFIVLHRELVDLLKTKNADRIHDVVHRHFIDVINWSDEHREDSI
jgi:DNA-binding FadR family transcriptional regulator